MNKKALIVVTALAMAITAPTAYAGQWYKENNKWAYRNDDGTQTRDGWFKDTDGRWYYFNGGVILTGDNLIDGKRYYFDDTSGEMKTGLVNGTYFYGLSGVRQTGWVRVNNVWYYFDPSNGKMVKGSLKDISGEKFYFKDDGTMAINEWIDSQYYAGSTGAILTTQWVDGTYVNSKGKATDKDKEDDSTDGTKKKIPNKTLSANEYTDLVYDAESRYYTYFTTVANSIDEWRDAYNEEKVYNYEGDDDTYVERNELKEWGIESDTEMCRAATLRAVELASCQRASGSRPDGRSVETIFADLGIDDVKIWAESVAFGYDDGDACYEELESNSTHTGYWKNVNYTRAGVGVACDADGRMYCVVMYAQQED